MMKEMLLKNIANIQAGYQTRAGIEEDPGGAYKLIQGRDLNDICKLNVNDLLHFTPERKPERYFVKKRDILFKTRGLDHTAYFVEEELENTLASGAFYIIRIQNNYVLPAFLAWWLNQPDAKKYFEALSKGTIMSFVSKKSMLNLHVPIPPLKIQKEITNIVSLRKHEKGLQSNLELKRDNLIERVCRKAIHKK